MISDLVGFFSRIIPPGSEGIGALKIAIAVLLGLLLGAIRVRGIRLGISAVLFSSLALAQFGVQLPPDVLAFARDFSLVLFVYAIGLQVGPGFLSSLRSEGVRLNLLALLVVVLGAVMTAACAWAFAMPRDSASGLYAGAFTTTPGLAAGQDALRHLLSERQDRLAAAIGFTGLAYAVSYPFGVVGPSLVIVLLRRIFSVRLDHERAELLAAQAVRQPPVRFLDIEITRPEYGDLPLHHHPALNKIPVTLTRYYHNGQLSVPTADTVIHLGDVIRAVGPQAKLDALAAELGRPSATDLGVLGGNVKRMDLVITNPQVLRRPLRELDLIRRTGVTFGLVTRAGVDLIPTASLALKFGDRVSAVGPEQGLKMVEAEVGNSTDSLNTPRLLPIFIGIVLGVLIGLVPIRFPGMNVQMQIGLAGGPMLAAIALSQLGNVGSVVWYMPTAANQIIRDLGLAVFLACVGFQTGPHFIDRIAHGGIAFILVGAAITILPLLIVGWIARAWFKMNFITLSGWIAGTMTSSPALLFANESSGSDAPAIAYATVAPLCMLAPIVCAQLLAIVSGAR